MAISERDQAIAAAYIAGERTGVIAARYNITRQRVDQIARSFGCPKRNLPVWRDPNYVPRPQVRWTDSDDARMRRLRSQGKSYGEIAVVFGNRTRNACIGRGNRLGL